LHSKQAGGQQALDLVTYEKDPKVIAICETWAGDYDSSASIGMGFQVDDKKTGFADAVGDFVAELKASGE
jgi:D-erythronate 2-dehydrogenase